MHKGILHSPLRQILQPVLRSVIGGGGIGQFLANLLTEEGERIQTEENSNIQQERNNG